ncbi:MAG: hypothetical protein DRP47_05100 [Candidatus Zixiibacteriota bacterium]|nr:MAG: hypothetical protein DRP47_05100 [candidate division Zixibacteria bacterium]
MGNYLLKTIATLGVLGLAPGCPGPTQRDVAIRALEESMTTDRKEMEKLGYGSTHFVKCKIINDSTYYLTYSSGKVEKYAMSISTTSGENGDTTYIFRLEGFLPSKAKITIGKNRKVKRRSMYP